MGACFDSNLYGGHGDDVINVVEGRDNTLCGGMGNDRPVADDLNNELYGTLGNDTLIASRAWADSNCALHGGAGNDSLTAQSGGNVLDGGEGDDRLSSVLTNAVHGNVLTGGGGKDEFRLDGPAHFSITNDADRVLELGDVIAGRMDEITDYKAGETLDVFGQGLTRTTSVGLADPAPGADQGHRHVVIGANTYAVFHGQQSDPDTFVASANGNDTLVVYGANSEQFPVGAVVLEDFTGDILIA